MVTPTFATMDATTLGPVIRKKVLRMIPCGIHVITARHESRIATATIDPVTPASFDPPMVVCRLRRDSLIYDLVVNAGICAKPRSSLSYRMTHLAT